jgi:hypothetical protein
MNVQLGEDEYSDSELENLEQLYLKALRKKLLGGDQPQQVVPPALPEPPRGTPASPVKVKPSKKAQKPEYQNIQAVSEEPEKKPRGRPKKIPEIKVQQAGFAGEPQTPPPPPTPIQASEAPASKAGKEEPKTLQNYNKAYYAEKKHEIAKKKLLKRIEKGENVSEKLLEKYGLKNQ